MFESFKRFWKGLKQMFGYTTLKRIVGKDITLSDNMISAVNNWRKMLDGNADWLTDSVDPSARRRDLPGVCRRCALVEMETSLSNERLDKMYQRNRCGSE